VLLRPRPAFESLAETFIRALPIRTHPDQPRHPRYGFAFLPSAFDANSKGAPEFKSVFSSSTAHYALSSTPLGLNNLILEGM
jgi:hypothetical protein